MKNRSMQDSRIVKPRVTKTKLPSETSNSLSQETGFQRESSEDLENPAFFINRELSWLKFNERVLLQALDPKNPLLERVKFLSIVATNLDKPIFSSRSRVGSRMYATAIPATHGKRTSLVR